MNIHEEQFLGHTLEIWLDKDPLNPRTEYDNIGKMVCFHKRYTLGDTQVKGTTKQVPFNNITQSGIVTSVHNHRNTYNFENYNSWDELREEIEHDSGPCKILPIFMLDHSGLAINTTGFSCSFDSGQLGYIYCSEARALNAGIDFDKLEEHLVSEVATYDLYLSGQCYGWSWNDDSCRGYLMSLADLIEIAKVEIRLNVEYMQKERKTNERTNMRMQGSRPTEGQFIAVWEYKGTLWSETLKWVNNEVLVYNSVSNAWSTADLEADEIRYTYYVKEH